MIEHIRTIGFKGFDLDEGVPQKVLYCGKNRSGKSTRAAAIALVIYGHIPFLTSGKLPRDIMDSYGSGDSLVVSATISGVEFARKFSRTDTGAAQKIQVNGKKKTAQEFAVALHDAGAPKIANTSEFMAQSENKKIDTLFDIFPVGDDLNALDNEIEQAKAEVSNIDKKKKGAVAVVQRLTESKSKIELPSGSLAEVKTEIGAVDIQIKDLQKEIKQAEIEEAKENSKKEAENNLLDKQEEERKSEEKETPPLTSKTFVGDGNMSNPQVKTGGTAEPVGFDHEYREPYRNTVVIPAENIRNPSDSIQRIIGALENSGCSVCAAMIVAKQELKKYMGVS